MEDENDEAAGSPHVPLPQVTVEKGRGRLGSLEDSRLLVPGAPRVVNSELSSCRPSTFPLTSLTAFCAETIGSLVSADKHIYVSGGECTEWLNRSGHSSGPDERVGPKRD